MRNASWSIYFVSTFLVGLTSASVLSQENNQPPPGFTALFNGRNIDEWAGATTRDPGEIPRSPLQIAVPILPR